MLQAIGGSTNAVIHLTAIAGRLGIRLELERLDELAATTPLLVDLKPSGEGYMEDFYRAGGMRVVMHELQHLLHLDAPTITGQTWRNCWTNRIRFPAWQNVIRPASDAIAARTAR